MIISSKEDLSVYLNMDIENFFLLSGFYYKDSKEATLEGWKEGFDLQCPIMMYGERFLYPVDSEKIQRAINQFVHPMDLL